MSRFTKATKRQAKARVALIGLSGSGKTFTALRIARSLVGPTGRIALIDTEHGSASKYAGDVAEFDALDLEQHSPKEYIAAIRDAANERYDALIIDSLSHAWSGRGGALEQVDNAAKRNGGNSFGAWRDVTPQHNALVEALLAFPGHLFVTMRAKTEYVVEQTGKGKSAPRKVGLAPVQRDGIEYEFDVVADLDIDHNFVVSKSRCSKLAGLVVQCAGEEVATVLRAWLDDGAEAAPTRAIVDAPSTAGDRIAPELDDDQQARARAQAASGQHVERTTQKSPERQLADGLIDHAKANVGDIDTLREWIAGNRAAVLALSTRAVSYTLGGVCKHAMSVVDGMNEGGFRDEWRADEKAESAA